MLSRKNMEKLMYDVYIAEAMIENDYSSFDTPEKKEALINEVLNKHRTTQAQWDTSLSWYSDRIEIYLKMNDSVKARLQRSQRATEQIMNLQYRQEQSLSPHTYLPSYIPPHYAFNDANPRNGFRFRLDTAQIAQKITDAHFNFGFRAIGIPANSTPRFQTMLMLQYKDTAIYRSETITENRNYILSGQKYIPGDTIQEIAGFVKLQDTIGLYRNIRLKNIFLGNPNNVAPQNESNVPEPQEMILREDRIQPQ
ncbi:MAG: DUF4296 domain-containing protein [Bacteroidia bacterium]|nr:DUF4296 domain-containing protein [Bacteroidia bacterium]